LVMGGLLIAGTEMPRLRKIKAPSSLHYLMTLNAHSPVVEALPTVA